MTPLDQDTTQSTFDFTAQAPTQVAEPTNGIPYGYCHCGCGQKTNVPTFTSRTKNIFKGVPSKYISGHNRPTPPIDADRPHKNARRCACGGWRNRSVEKCRECWNKEDKPPIDPEIYIIGGKPRRQIPLTQGQYALVDAHNYERLMKFNYYAQWNPTKRGFYAKRNICANGKRLGLMMGYDVIEIPEGKIPHHLKQRETLNYCEDNLKAANYEENAHDRLKGINNTSGRKNIDLYDGKWRVRVRAGGKTYYGGSYDDFAEACKVQEAMISELHGEFACIGDE